jgi:hypothetical protein
MATDSFPTAVPSPNFYNNWALVFLPPTDAASDA